MTKRVAHDPGSFTQGLAWRGRVLYEGSGMHGASTLRRVSLAGGDYKVLRTVSLPQEMFGEGVTLVPGEEAPEAAGAPPPTVFQLTWQNGKVYTYDADTLEQQPGSPFTFTSTSNEGWGLTHNGRGTLIMSDGSSSLHFWSASAQAYTAAGAMVAARAPLPVVDASPASQEVLLPHPPSDGGWYPPPTAQGGVRTRLPEVLGQGFGQGSAVGKLNELEYVHGWVFSNVWYDKSVAIIDPETGQALWYLDMSPLYADNAGRDCLNGLAYTMLLDAAAPEEEVGRVAPADKAWGGRLWVTGKYWNYLYEM